MKNVESYKITVLDTTNKICGVRIKRDSSDYQSEGLGAVPKFRSTRRTCILVLIRCLTYINISPSRFSPHIQKQVILLVYANQGLSFNSFPTGPFFVPKRCSGENYELILSRRITSKHLVKLVTNCYNSYVVFQ